MLFGGGVDVGSVAPSRPDPVVEVNYAAFEVAFVQQFEFQTDTLGERPFAASHYDRAKNRWHSSTNPASSAWAARSGPPTLMSRSA